MHNSQTNTYDLFSFINDHFIKKIAFDTDIPLIINKRRIVMRKNDYILIEQARSQNKMKDYQFNNNITDTIYFLNTNDKLVKLDIATMSEEILYPELSFKSILTLYRTDIQAICQVEDGRVYYINNGIYRFVWKMDFDELKYYIGSNYNTNINYGMFASNRMLYKLRAPSIKIRANFIYYDKYILLCKKTRLSAMNLIF